MLVEQTSVQVCHFRLGIYASRAFCTTLCSCWHLIKWHNCRFGPTDVCPLYACSCCVSPREPEEVWPLPGAVLSRTESSLAACEGSEAAAARLNLWRLNVWRLNVQGPNPAHVLLMCAGHEAVRRVFSGCVTGRRPARLVQGDRLSFAMCYRLHSSMLSMANALYL